MADIENLVHATSASTGTGDITLAAVNGKQSFNDAFGTGGTDLFYYFISNRGAAEWEVGTGHLSDSTTLARDTVLASSNAGSAVSFSAGTKDVTNSLPAAEWIARSEAMLKSTYDPTGVGGDAFDMDEMVDGSGKVAMTTTERSKLTNIEDNADVTDAENVAAAGAVMDGDFSANGFMVRTAAGTYASRTLTGTANQIGITNTTGAGNPVFSLAAAATTSLGKADTALQPAGENQGPVTGGAAITSKSLGTITTGTLTLDMGDCALQHYTANGAHTLAPGTVRGACILDVINGASAGSRTLSGWTKVEGSFTNTNAQKFRCHCSVGEQGSLLIIQALQ